MALLTKDDTTPVEVHEHAVCEGACVDDLIADMPGGPDKRPECFYVADTTTLTHPEHPLLAPDRTRQDVCSTAVSSIDSPSVIQRRMSPTGRTDPPASSRSTATWTAKEAGTEATQSTPANSSPPMASCRRSRIPLCNIRAIAGSPTADRSPSAVPAATRLANCPVHAGANAVVTTHSGSAQSGEEIVLGYGRASGVLDTYEGLHAHQLTEPLLAHLEEKMFSP